MIYHPLRRTGVSQAFQMDRGGYYVHVKAGKPQQVFGEDVKTGAATPNRT
jgi:hypothetical protein